MKQWFYSENGEQLGPVSEQDLVAQFRNGRSLETLVWAKGMPEWLSASNVGVFAPPGSIPPPMPSGTSQAPRKAETDPWSKAELLEVARHQKYLQWLMLAYFVLMFVRYGTIVVGLIAIYFIFKLAKALRSRAAWVYIITSFFPIIGVLALLHIVVKATNVLRSNGIGVGLMGAKMEDFAKL